MIHFMSGSLDNEPKKKKKERKNSRQVVNLYVLKAFPKIQV